MQPEKDKEIVQKEYLSTDKDGLNSTQLITFSQPHHSAFFQSFFPISYIQSISEDADPFQPGEPAQHGIEINEITGKDLKQRKREGTIQF